MPQTPFTPVPPGTPGTPVTGYDHLMRLKPCVPVRFRDSSGQPGLAIRNEDGTFAVTGMGNRIEGRDLWVEISDPVIPPGRPFKLVPAQLTPRPARTRLRAAA